jgi:hypothetical protein
MRSLPFIPALVLLTGCSPLVVPVPHTTVRDYKISGTILDARTHAPIPNALVYRTEHPRFSCYTDASGRFVLKEVHNWHYAKLYGIANLQHLPAKEFWGDNLFTVSNANYAQRTIDLYFERGPTFFLDKPGETTQQRRLSLTFDGSGSILKDAGAGQYLRPGDIRILKRLKSNVEDRPSSLHIGFVRHVINPRITAADQPDTPQFSLGVQNGLDWEFGITYFNPTEGEFLQDRSRVYRLEFIP